MSSKLVSEGRGKFKSSHRFELECITYALCLYRPHPLVVELGSGEGSFARDLFEYISEAKLLTIDRLRLDLVHPSHHHQQIELTDLTVNHLPQAIDVLMANRVLHYLSYADCIEVLKMVRQNSAVSTFRGFITISGLDSRLGIDYPDADKPVHQRYSKLSVPAQLKFEISQPVCLYTPEDVKKLLKTCGFCIERIWKSGFGNIKVIFSCD